MSQRLLITVILVLAIGGASNVAHAAKRIAVVVGHNQGLAGDHRLRYAEADAEKVAKVLVDLGGFATGNVHLIRGPSRSALEAALNKLARDTADEQAEVFFYYSGHGDGASIHIGGERVAVDSIKQHLQKMRAKLRVLIVDSCQSGELTRTKGATVGPAFDLTVNQASSAAGTIVITSSSQSEVSQESDRLQGSFFTHYWVSGLYGSADANGDALVTLEEAYRFAHYQTVDGTIASRAGVQHPSYNFALSGEGSVIMANLSRSTATIRLLPGGVAGGYFVVDPSKQLVLTEIRRGADGSATIHLPPGNYRIRKREDKRFLERDLRLAAADDVTLRDADMRVAAYEAPSSKGGSPRLFGVEAHGPLALVGARSPISDAYSKGLDVMVGYQLEWGSVFVRPRIRLVDSQATNRLVTGDLLEVDGGGALGWYLHQGNTSVAVGLDAGLVVFREDRPRDVLLDAPAGVLPVGGELSGFIEAHLAIAGDLRLVASGRFGGEAFSRDGRFVIEPLVMGSVGLAFIVR